ncbi:universal stress protein [Plantactinospora sp. GCM10030261]|uniref:universal stress protein n=1 Tax=Plantactinospora sp. GCM10030261 TaxID=3273420 RepID=UPI00361A0195
MDGHRHAAVVVGVDGSPDSRRAIELAAAEARRRRRPLRVVHAFVWPTMHVDVRPPPAGPEEGGLRHQAERIVADALAEARRAAPDVPVDGEIVDGQPAAVLIKESCDACLVVIGDRGLGGFASLLLGSIALQTASYAASPVLVARGTEHPGPVVVGVDGSETSQRALAVAVEEAAVRGAELRAVHAFRHPRSTGPGDMMPLVYDTESLRAEEDRRVAEAVAPWQDRYPDVPMIRRVAHGRAAPTLIEESARAQLLVIGARGRGGLAGLILGSVSQAVLHHAECPTVIAPMAHDGPPHG